MGAIIRAHTPVMNGIIFLVEDAAGGGFIASASGVAVFAQADNIDELYRQLRVW